MNPAGRVFFGAAIGALLTLALHPVSRPFLDSVLDFRSAEVLRKELVPQGDRLPDPQTVQEAALWVTTAAEKIVAGEKLDPVERRSVLTVVEAAGKRDPENAFWHQMRAVLLDRAGRRAEADAAWTRAAASQAWNDYQSARLLNVREGLVKRMGARQAWQLAYVYQARSDACARLIESYARNRVSQTDLDDSRSLQTRFITLRNGSLLRDGSRSIALGQRGASIVEVASYPDSLSGMPSPKKLVLAQIAMYNRLRDEGRISQAQDAFEAFRKNDGWRALTQLEDTEEYARKQSLLGVISGVLPGVVLASSLVGVLLWLFGKAVEAGGKPRFGVLTIAALTIVLGAVTFALSRSHLTAAVVGLSSAFLAFGAPRTRSTETDEVGLLFGFLCGFLATAFFGILGVYLIGWVLPARALREFLGGEWTFLGDTALFVGLVALIFALLMVTASVWAWVQRRNTPFMLGLALRKFGASLALGAMGLAMVLTPACVYFDHRVENTLRRLVENEPVYYLLR